MFVFARPRLSGVTSERFEVHGVAGERRARVLALERPDALAAVIADARARR